MADPKPEPAPETESKTETLAAENGNQPPAEPDKQPEVNKRPVGRPLKFESPEKLQARIDQYFDNCDPHVENEVLELVDKANGDQSSRYRKRITQQKPYTIHGLARALDTSRETLRDYESGRYDDPERSEEDSLQFSDTITRAKARIAEFAEGMLYVSGASHGAQFNLKNNYGWKDESKLITENVGDDLDELDRLAGAEAAKANREALAEAADKELGDDPNGERSAATEPVVATDPPVQDTK